MVCLWHCVPFVRCGTDCRNQSARRANSSLGSITTLGAKADGRLQHGVEESDAAGQAVGEGAVVSKLKKTANDEEEEMNREDKEAKEKEKKKRKRPKWEAPFPQ